MVNKIIAIMNMSEETIRNHPHLLVNVFDHDHRILFWNVQCEHFFGISEEAALGKVLEDLVPYVRNNDKMSLLERAFEGQSVFVEVEKYLKREGFYEQILLPVKDDEGKVMAVLNIVRDIAETDYDHPGKFSLF